MKILSKNKYVTIYNFKIIIYHTYLVSNCDVLVHNNCKDSSKGTLTLIKRTTRINDRGTISESSHFSCVFYFNIKVPSLPLLFW